MREKLQPYIFLTLQTFIEYIGYENKVDYWKTVLAQTLPLSSMVHLVQALKLGADEGGGIPPKLAPHTDHPLHTWEVSPGNERSTLKCVLPQVSVARS